MIVVVKIGTSSLTGKTGAVDTAAIGQLADQLAEAHAEGHKLLLVTSGAITAGEAVLGIDRAEADAATLQALSTVGQHRLMATYEEAFSHHGIHVGQVLVAPSDFFERSRYLLARRVLERLLEIGVVPVVNENDAVADDAIGFGDNDRIAALVAHLVKADKLLLLTDMEGMFTADPRRDKEASLIAEIVEVNAELEAAAGAARVSAVTRRDGFQARFGQDGCALWRGSGDCFQHTKRRGDGLYRWRRYRHSISGADFQALGPQTLDRLRRALKGMHKGRQRRPQRPAKRRSLPAGCRRHRSNRRLRNRRCRRCSRHRRRSLRQRPGLNVFRPSPRSHRQTLRRNARPHPPNPPRPDSAVGIKFTTRAKV